LDPIFPFADVRSIFVNICQRLIEKEATDLEGLHAVARHSPTLLENEAMHQEIISTHAPCGPAPMGPTVLAWDPWGVLFFSLVPF